MSANDWVLFLIIQTWNLRASVADSRTVKEYVPTGWKEKGAFHQRKSAQPSPTQPKTWHVSHPHLVCFVFRFSTFSFLFSAFPPRSVSLKLVASPCTSLLHPFLSRPAVTLPEPISLRLPQHSQKGTFGFTIFFWAIQDCILNLMFKEPFGLRLLLKLRWSFPSPTGSSADWLEYNANSYLEVSHLSRLCPVPALHSTSQLTKLLFLPGVLSFPLLWFGFYYWTLLITLPWSLSFIYLALPCL